MEELRGYANLTIPHTSVESAKRSILKPSQFSRRHSPNITGSCSRSGFADTGASPASLPVPRTLRSQESHVTAHSVKL